MEPAKRDESFFLVYFFFSSFFTEIDTGRESIRLPFPANAALWKRPREFIAAYSNPIVDDSLFATRGHRPVDDR